MVYAAFGGHCDIAPYHGWVVGVTTAGHLTTLWSDEAGVAANGGQSGIWAAGALRSDGPGSLVLTTGNGNDPTTPLADTTPTGARWAKPWSTWWLSQTVRSRPPISSSPSTPTHLNTIDGDLGSGSPVLLPSSFSTPTHPHLAVVDRQGGLPVRPGCRAPGWL